MHKGRRIFTSQGMSDHQLVLRAVKLESLKGAIRQLLFDSQKQGETFRSKTSMFKQSIHRNNSGRSTSDSMEGVIRKHDRNEKMEDSGAIYDDYDDDQEGGDSHERDARILSRDDTRDLFDLREDLCRFCDYYPCHGKSCTASSFN